jgi:hypothetical protein
MVWAMDEGLRETSVELTVAANAYAELKNVVAIIAKIFIFPPGK